MGTIMDIDFPAHGDGLTRELYSPREVEYILAISHTMLYRLINDNKLEAKKINNKTVITAASIRRFIAGLPSFGAAEAGHARG
jgi:predicted DNA-binding transcriptional regulator AlpA